MSYRLKRMWSYWRFNHAVRGILETPPMPVVRPERCTIVSMVSQSDVMMYLVSMKAFYRRVGGGRIIAILARDTPRHQQDRLRHHFPGIELPVLEEIEVHGCQRGGTWERLVHILDRTDRGEYVVQVDCDVMPVTEEIPEIVACIEARRAFTMADHGTIAPVGEAAEFARGLQGDHIGIVTERLLDRLPGAAGLFYVRGSSGFAGFAPGGFGRRRIEEFHAEMEKLVGAQRWREWGTEQCASNFAVANTPGRGCWRQAGAARCTRSGGGRRRRGRARRSSRSGRPAP